MKRLLRFGFLAAISGLAACGDDEPSTTSNSETLGDASSTHDSLSSDVTITEESGSADTGVTVGSSDTGTGSSGGPATGSEGSSGESGHDSGSSDGSSETAACQPITEDTSALGQTCMIDGDCPTGYTCFDGGGLVSMPLCQILCTQDCECADSYACQHMDIKGHAWDQCNPG